MKRILHVSLNGTDANPYHKQGLTQNPFPQFAEHGYDAQCLHLQKLGGDPIPNKQYIRDHLEGWDKEFVDLCCKLFKKGEYVEFNVTWNE